MNKEKFQRRSFNRRMEGWRGGVSMETNKQEFILSLDRFTIYSICSFCTWVRTKSKGLKKTRDKRGVKREKASTQSRESSQWHSLWSLLVQTDAGWIEKNREKAGNWDLSKDLQIYKNKQIKGKLFRYYTRKNLSGEKTAFIVNVNETTGSRNEKPVYFSLSSSPLVSCSAASVRLSFVF